MAKGSLTANMVYGRVVTCYLESCEIYQDGSWLHLQKTRSPRLCHSSAATDEAIFLIGGLFSNSTEWVPIDGSPARPGPFVVRHSESHCTIQLSSDVVVVTGGKDIIHGYVTEYHLGSGRETPLNEMRQPRYAHACGVYQDASSRQVRRVYISLAFIQSFW